MSPADCFYYTPPLLLCYRQRHCWIPTATALTQMEKKFYRYCNGGCSTTTSIAMALPRRGLKPSYYSRRGVEDSSSFCSRSLRLVE